MHDKLITFISSNGTIYIDNPDQRITADTNIFCTIYGSIMNNLIVAPACIIYYTYDAYTRTGWIGPTAMFIIFLLRYFNLAFKLIDENFIVFLLPQFRNFYLEMFPFFCSSCINKFLMSPVVNLTVKKERYEGDFRFQHVFIRTNSESLAFYGNEAENVEKCNLDSKLGIKILLKYCIIILRIIF